MKKAVAKREAGVDPAVVEERVERFVVRMIPSIELPTSVSGAHAW